MLIINKNKINKKYAIKFLLICCLAINFLSVMQAQIVYADASELSYRDNSQNKKPAPQTKYYPVSSAEDLLYGSKNCQTIYNKKRTLQETAYDKSCAYLSKNNSLFGLKKYVDDVNAISTSNIVRKNIYNMLINDFKLKIATAKLIMPIDPYIKEKLRANIKSAITTCKDKLDIPASNKLKDEIINNTLENYNTLDNKAAGYKHSRAGAAENDQINLIDSLLNSDTATTKGFL